MKTKVLLILSFLVFAGCEPTQANQTLVRPLSVVPPVASPRFVLERIDIVQDETAYEKRRGIYILHDQKTGQEYIGVSGIGIAELGSHSIGKSSVQDER